MKAYPISGRVCESRSMLACEAVSGSCAGMEGVRELRDRAA